ncbi:hypothetical protein JQK88_07390 [Mesorhizobium caraganae]|uniref:hypothetical protein n=1 Tax=Mesorhizobium caraganae TaxID=483206 RepID=UPI00193A5D43|nr:hypothetical protein [Mesorhizobium caraganae]MBM2711074.1 hypothetical protein [Mesorhizobium caraganae]
MKTIKKVPQMMEFFLGKLQEDQDTHWVTTTASNVMDTMRWRLEEGQPFEIETSITAYIEDLALIPEDDFQPIGVVRYNWAFCEFYFRIAGFILENGRKVMQLSDVLTLLLRDLELTNLISMQSHDGKTIVKSSSEFNKQFNTRIDVTIG